MWDNRDFNSFWDSITNFLLKYTIGDPNFRNAPVKPETVNRLVHQINEGRYNFDRANRHEVWIVFENFMKNIQNPIVPENVAKIIRQCGWALFDFSFFKFLIL